MSNFYKKNLKGGLWLKSPTEKSERATFAIIQNKKYVKSEQLNSINKRFLEKRIGFEEAKLLIKNLMESMRPTEAVLFNSSNQRILKEYWNEEYEHRDLVDRKSAFHRLQRAVDALGSVSLTADRASLQTQLDQTLKGNKHRAVVAALNQILAWLKTGVKLRRAREEFEPVRFVTDSELKLVLAQIKDPLIKLMHEVAFGTGLRAGELFGIMPSDLEGRTLRVATQIDIHRARRAPKNRKERKALVFKAFLGALQKWLEVPVEERLKFRLRALSRITRQASKKALGREITFHDLRHSYAKHLISGGANLTDVSQLIGDSIRVTERYYSGFIATPEAIKRLSSQF